MTDTWVIGIVVLLFTYAGTVLGFVLQGVLPKGQLVAETRDIVKLVIGLLGTLSALVLGLMISSARNSYDRQSQEVVELSSKIVALDRTLALYGPETKSVRDEFRSIVAAAADRMWPTDRSQPGRVDPSRAAETFYHRLQQLRPGSDDQRFYHGRAMNIATELLNGRWLLYQQSTSTISVPFVVVIIFWFALIFACIGILTPRTPTMFAMLFLCAVSVAGAVVLAFELDEPFAGVLRVSREPIQRALTRMGQQ